MKGLIFLVALLLPFTVYAGSEQEFEELLALEEGVLNSVKPQERCPGLAKFVPVAMAVGGIVSVATSKTEKTREVDGVIYDDEKLEALAQIDHEIEALGASGDDSIYYSDEWKNLNKHYRSARAEYYASGEPTSMSETYYEHNYAPGAFVVAILSMI